MLLVIYNSNPQNKSDLPTIRGWSLYTEEDWRSLWVDVDSYFFHMPTNDAELTNGLVSYYSHEEWLSDYQVSNIDFDGFDYQYIQFLNSILGTDFYVPDIVTQHDDDPVYPEMDAYA